MASKDIFVLVLLLQNYKDCAIVVDIGNSIQIEPVVGNFKIMARNYQEVVHSKANNVVIIENGVI